MHLDLKIIDFQLHVYYCDQWIFDVRVDHDATYISYFGKAKDKVRKNQKIQADFFINSDQIRSQFEMVKSRFQRQLKNVWERNDYVGEVTKTFKNIWSQLFTKEVTDLISIGSDIDAKTRLERLYKDNLQVDFKIQIRTLDSIVEYNVLDSNVIDLKITNMVNEVAKKIENINLGSAFLENSKNLYWLLQQEINDVSYCFSSHSKWNNLHLPTKDAHLYINFYYQNFWFCDIELYLKEMGRKWIMSFYGESDIWERKIKNEL